MMINDRLSQYPQAVLLFILALAFGIHYAVLSYLQIPIGSSLTWQAYLFNLLAAQIILTVMLRIAQKKQDYLGFIFMGGSLLKFLVFFLAFYPVYKEDGEISSLEFSSFFVPYLICLAFKSFVLLRSLNKA